MLQETTTLLHIVDMRDRNDGNLPIMVSVNYINLRPGRHVSLPTPQNNKSYLPNLYYLFISIEIKTN